MITALRSSDWVESTTADNSTATASRAAPSGGISHYVTSVSGGFDSSVSGATLILKDGATEKARWLVFDSFTETFSSPIRITPGNAVSLELAASGTGGVSGTCNLVGYTL